MASTSKDEERAAELLFNTRSRIFERALVYLNLITIAGYASTFALWHFVQDDLSRNSRILIALLLMTSILIFVLFEVFKMVVVQQSMLEFQTIVAKNLPAAEFLKEMQTFEKRQHQRMLTIQVPIWKWTFPVCVATALTAVLILIANLIYLLLAGTPVS